jgi:hypothetical protein
MAFGSVVPSLNITGEVCHFPPLFKPRTVSPTLMSPIGFHLSLEVSTGVLDDKQLHLQ